MKISERDFQTGVAINIPMLPGRELNPNWRGHWSKKARAVKSFRDAAHVCALNDSNFTRPEYEKAELSITLVIRDLRYYRDPDNMISSLKPFIDGIVDAGILKDDSDEHLRYRLPIMYQVDKQRAPMTILEFKALP